MSGIPSVAWIKQYPDVNTVGNDQGPSIAVDSSGNTYISYWTNAGSVSGGTNAGGTGDIVVFKLNKDGQIVWVKQNILINTSAIDQNPSIILDSSSNIYIAYNTTGRVSGGSTLGNNDIVVFKMDSSGNVLWITQQRVMNTNQNDIGPSISIDSSNNLYIAYECTGTVSGGTNIGLRDAAVFKMDSSGNVIWIKEYPLSNTTANDYSPSLITDSSGNSYISYHTLGGTVSGGTTGGGSFDIVIFKLDSSGNFLWAVQNPQISTNQEDTATTLALDSSSNLYLAFSNFFGTESYNISVVKLDSNGTFIWKKSIQSINNGAESNPSIVINSSGIYITFSTNDIMSGGTNIGFDDIVVCMLDFDGNTLWILQQPLFNTNLIDTSPSITVDSSNNVYIAYTTTGTVSGGTFIGSQSGTATNTNIVIFKLSLYPSAPLITSQPTSASNQLTFTWSPPTFTGGVPITSYILTNGTLTYNLDSSITSYTVSPLFNNYPYTFRIAATNQYGTSLYANFNTSVIYVSPTLSWIKEQAVFNTSSSDNTPSIDVDSSGNTYIAYCTQGGTVSGGTNFVGTSTTSDIVIFKLDTNGNVVWVKQQSFMNTSSNDTDPSLSVDSSGNIYVAYYTNGTTSGGTQLGSGDIVVFKMNTNGILLWIRQQPVMNTSSFDTYPSLSVDIDGNSYIAYYTSLGTVSGGTRNSISADIVVFKLNTSGTLQWIRQERTMNSSSTDIYPSISVDSSANIYVAYQTYGRTSGGTLKGFYDIVVFKMNTSGTLQWIRQQPIMNSSSTSEYPSISVDSSGNTYVAYHASGRVSGGTSSGSNDIVVFKMDTNGTLLWIKQEPIMNTSSIDWYPSIAVDSVGNVYVTYITLGTVSGGTRFSGYNIVVFQMDTNGSLLWIYQTTNINTNNTDYNPRICVDSSGNVYVAYETAGIVSGGTNSGGIWDIAVFKLQFNTPLSAPPVFVRPLCIDSSLQFWWKPITDSNPFPQTSFLLTDGNISYTLSPDTYTFLVPNLTNGTSYSFSILGSNAVGLGISSSFRTVQPGSLSDSITNFQVEDQPNQFVFTWTNPSNYGSVTPIRNIVTCFPVDLSDNIIPNKANYIYASTYADKTVRVIEKTSFTPSTRYKAAAQVVNDVGYSPIVSYSSIFSV
jgi:hypothetical protein